jgi:CRP-like cAMP-binding protein
MSTVSQPPDAPGLAGLLQMAGDEALLPAGSRLCDEERAGRQCFVIVDGAATVERHGSKLRTLSSGAFVGQVDASGWPLPPAGVTIRLDVRSRVLVLDPTRLRALLDAEPAWAGALQHLTSGL